jgi:hypothetical protein
MKEARELSTSTDRWVALVPRSAVVVCVVTSARTPAGATTGRDQFRRPPVSIPVWR